MSTAKVPLSLKTTHKTWLGGAVLVLLMAVAMAYAAWGYRQIGLASDERRDPGVVIQLGNEFFLALLDAETGQRGYALTGDAAYLAPYVAGRDFVGQRLAVLRQLTPNGQERAHLDAIAPLLDAKVLDMENLVDLRRSRDMTGLLARIKLGEGKRLMDKLRVEFNSYMALQESEKSIKQDRYDASMRRMLFIMMGFAVLAVGLALYIAYTTYRAAQHQLKTLVHQETRHLLQAQQAANAQLQAVNDSLQVSEAKLAVTLNSIGDGVIATDVHARIILLNPVAENLTGWSQAQALGRPVEDIFHILNKQTRSRARIPIAEALAHGAVQGLANHTVLVSRDGREFDIADSCAPIRALEDEVVGAVLVFRNVTEEHAVQQTLRDSAALVQTILNTVVDGIVTIYAQGGMVESVNPAIENMFGYTSAELTGKAFGELVPELDQDQHQVALAHYGASDAAVALGQGREVMGRRKDGSLFPLEISVGEMTLRGQRYFTGILRDISTRREAQAERAELDRALHDQNEELERARAVADKANLAKSEFLSSMSHELRSPLNAILGFAQLMESGTPAPTPSQAGSIQQILKAGWYLLTLINEILDLALIESGRTSLSMEPVSLAEVMLDCKTMIEPLALKRGIRMQFPVFAAPCFVAADATRLKQVIVNLLSNAIKYNRVNGSLQVLCREGSLDHLHISVHDSGEGLSAYQLTQLFQPFNRLGQEGNAQEGTGIGLVVSKRLMELMGGSIGALSTVGVGSEFWLELKNAQAPQLVTTAVVPFVALPLAGLPGERVRTLLYVEDNLANMELVAQLVARRPSLALLRAGDGVRGIAQARAELPDVILMDINLPGISGLEALAILRDDPRTRHIPVMALSANAMPRDVDRGMESGFYRYLTKPIRIVEFMQALDEGLLLAKTAFDHEEAMRNAELARTSAV